MSTTSLSDHPNWRVKESVIRMIFLAVIAAFVFGPCTEGHRGERQRVEEHEEVMSTLDSIQSAATIYLRFANVTLEDYLLAITKGAPDVRRELDLPPEE